MIHNYHLCIMHNTPFSHVVSYASNIVPLSTNAAPRVRYRTMNLRHRSRKDGSITLKVSSVFYPFEFHMGASWRSDICGPWALKMTWYLSHFIVSNKWPQSYHIPVIPKRLSTYGCTFSSPAYIFIFVSELCKLMRCAGCDFYTSDM